MVPPRRAGSNFWLLEKCANPHKRKTRELGVGPNPHVSEGGGSLTRSGLTAQAPLFCIDFFRANAAFRRQNRTDPRV